MQVRKQQLELDMEQQTGSKQERTILQKTENFLIFLWAIEIFQRPLQVQPLEDPSFLGCSHFPHPASSSDLKL